MLRYPKNLRVSDTVVYFLVYLPIDLYSSRSRVLGMAGLDGSTFKLDFKAALTYVLKAIGKDDFVLKKEQMQ